MFVDVLNWCRLCANVNENQTDLFIKSESLNGIQNIVYEHFNISQNDNLPSKICNKCEVFLTQLVAYYDVTRRSNQLYEEFLADNLCITTHESINVLRNKYQFDDIQSKNQVDEESDGNYFEDFIVKSESKLSCIDIEYEDNLKIIGTQQKKKKIKKKRGTRKLNSCNSDVIKSECIVKSESIEVQADPKDIFTNQLEEAELFLTEEASKAAALKKEKDFECEFCKKVFHLYHNFVTHKESNICRTDIVYHCDKCPATFTSKKKLQNHGRSHLTFEEKLVHGCDYCDKKFCKKTSAIAHMKTIHLGEKIFVCEQCGKSCTTKTKLGYHMAKHTDERPFQCLLCPMRFKSRPVFKCHVETHSDTKFPCKICGLELNTKKTLYKHMVVHSDEKKFECKFCGKAFKRSKTLLVHERSHTDDRPYCCQFCSSRFNYKQHCRIHEKNSHAAEILAMSTNNLSVDVGALT